MHKDNKTYFTSVLPLKAHVVLSYVQRAQEKKPIQKPPKNVQLRDMTGPDFRPIFAQKLAKMWKAEIAVFFCENLRHFLVFLRKSKALFGFSAKI